MSPAAIDLLHVLGYVYLRHGQGARAAVLLMVAGRAAPERRGIQRTLAAALIAAGLGDRAIAVLDHIEAAEPDAASHPMMRLMRARALLLQGRSDEARTIFTSQPDRMAA
jgi:type III secretion protein Y